MGITRIEVNEYTCELCGYKWVNRINGKDGPVPLRCAKCKNQHWEKGHIGALEQSYRDAIKHKFGYFHYIGGTFYGGWQTEKNVKRYLQRRPSVDEMKVLLHPMCYRYTYQISYAKPKIGSVPDFSLMRFKRIKRVDMKATEKAHEYENQLSRQLLKELMAQRGIPYDEKEAKIQSLYSIHGKYAAFALLHIPELCTALKEDQPELSNEDIKSKILEEWSEQLKYRVASPEELIQSCWPDWLK